MKLFDVVIKEYLTIIDYLTEIEEIENNRIIIDKEYFKKLLEKNQYMKFNQKTKIYKDLNFLVHDKNNYTMPYKDPVQGKTVRKVIFNYNTYTTVKKLFETDINI